MDYSFSPDGGGVLFYFWSLIFPMESGCRLVSIGVSCSLPT